MEELSSEAREVLREFGEAREPTLGAQKQTWSRLEDQMRREDVMELEVARVRRRRRGAARRIWLGFRPAVIATVLVSAMVVAWTISSRRTGDALLNDARLLLERGEHAQAYAVLVQHSRAYETKSAAERRMGLVLDALCGLGKKDRARRALERYLHMNPDSEHAARLDSLCGETPAPTPVAPPATVELDGAVCEPEEPVCDPDKMRSREHLQGLVVHPGPPPEEPWFSTATPE